MFRTMTHILYFRKRGEHKVYSANKKFFGSTYYIDFGNGEQPYTVDDIGLQISKGNWIVVDK